MNNIRLVSTILVLLLETPGADLSKFHIFLLNSPNLNFLEIRDLEKYGRIALLELVHKLKN